jgi:DNA-binding NarL/FixJ family response regulator
VRSVCLVNESAARAVALECELRAAGYFVTSSLDDVVDAIVVVADALPSGLPPCAVSEIARAKPVIVIAQAADPECKLRAAVDGAVGFVTAQPDANVSGVLDAVLAPDAPPLAEQRRRARIEALEGLARGEAPAATFDERCRVHLTRLEHGPVRTLPASPPGSRFALCTSNQLALLRTIAREGNVAKAACTLGTSRSSVYATLRRIAHRMQLRDSHELLRLVHSGALPAPT